MAELTTVARPYAEAVFAIAQEANALDTWSKMLGFAAAVAADPTMQAVVDNPRLSDDQKAKLFFDVCGEKLDAAGKRFLRVLLDAGRAKLLPQIQALFEARKNEAERAAKAEITSALPLSESELADLKAALERRFKLKIEASFKVDPSLIGGVRVVVGDQVVDASVQGKLAVMARELHA
ncbi:F-type H+-transporting ATPase subunit delta [Burkholderiales bacterium]|nr:MAG: F0F1 ATP synthase subunit delta [Burkholderiales bacterium]CAG0969502.1 F-type H+-transporting ATPase subunit delta [Burkholderiales bacterium]